MKKLLKYLSPFAPDDSGACSVFYELGGITVICDAGGCTGNVCGFDEPRWHEKKSALFSAGLRDMDAILGRDDMLVKKLAKVCTQIPAEFTAIIGTPVPAVIGTDFKALERMSEKATNLPCIAVETTGTNYYDKGEEKAYYALFEKFAVDKFPTKKGKVGIIGATPLDTGFTHAKDVTRGMNFEEIVCFGMDSGLDEIRRASECEFIFVISPAGIKSAKLLKERFGIPYQDSYICNIPSEILGQIEDLWGKNVLIVHEQFAANYLRGWTECGNVDCATWFMFLEEYAKENDFRIKSEEDFLQKIQEREYDVIIADSNFKRLLKHWDGQFIPFPHYAVSAELRNDRC